MLNAELLQLQLLNNDVNIEIDNGNGDESFTNLVFAGEPVVHLGNETDFWDILVLLGLFQSRSQVRKDQKWSKILDIPMGYNEYELGKKRLKLSINKPHLYVE